MDRMLGSQKESDGKMIHQPTSRIQTKIGVKYWNLVFLVLQQHMPAGPVNDTFRTSSQVTGYTQQSRERTEGRQCRRAVRNQKALIRTRVLPYPAWVCCQRSNKDQNSKDVKLQRKQIFILKWVL
ncbi:hypothetical protein O6H91_15G042800 [Diphasiastrum complanatum]|uniref:Uncharacterized protein n=1 Tax=Diphasiastrum complanatum TaxID=34168 RepID=A0ACC2BHX2_DIPCM|nr:hypothetical protein O6H91_15G042800 [Diphasiastrum complanatum]